MKEVKIATRLINENGKLSFSFSVNDIVDENGERIFKAGDDVIVQISENTSLFASAQKQDCLKWSEEDEYCIHQLILFCEKCMVQDSGAIRCTNWLKSLKERYTWKPSESDILLLERIANGKSNPQDFQASLCGLIGQLKELKG